MHFLRPLRLNPDSDVRQELQNWCKLEKISAACIVSAVGSLKQTNIRLADSNEHYQSQEPHEIIHFSGLLSTDGLHIHLSVADKNGKVLGGHLSLGNKVHTTLEIVIAIAEGYEFLRTFDPKTGYKELEIKQKNS